jgi:hypothetical protein
VLSRPWAILSRLAAGPLSAAQCRHFQEQGYLIFDSRAETDVLDGVVAETAGRYEGWTEGSPYRSVRVHDAWRLCPAVRALALHAPILRVLEQLFGRRPRPFQTLNFPVGTGQRPHSDTIHFNSMPRGLMAGVWVALEDIDEDNGPLVFYPGSHTLPELMLQDIGQPKGIEHNVKLEDFLGRLIEDRKLRPSLGLMRKGQAIVWASNLLHGGWPQKDHGRTRHSQATHYFFDGCEYHWRPFFSEPDAHARFDPTWIT